jgi:hypothetical protein
MSNREGLAQGACVSTRNGQSNHRVWETRQSNQSNLGPKRRTQPCVTLEQHFDYRVFSSRLTRLCHKVRHKVDSASDAMLRNLLKT